MIDICDVWLDCCFSEYQWLLSDDDDDDDGDGDGR